MSGVIDLLFGPVLWGLQVVIAGVAAVYFFVRGELLLAGIMAVAFAFSVPVFRRTLRQSRSRG